MFHEIYTYPCMGQASTGWNCDMEVFNQLHTLNTGLILPFYPCKQSRPILNSSRHSCVKLVCLKGDDLIRPVLICPQAMRAEEGGGKFSL